MSSLLNQAINIITTTIASAKEAKRKGGGGGATDTLVGQNYMNGKMKLLPISNYHEWLAACFTKYKSTWIEYRSHDINRINNNNLFGIAITTSSGTIIRFGYVMGQLLADISSYLQKKNTSNC